MTKYEISDRSYSGLKKFNFKCEINRISDNFTVRLSKRSRYM